MTERIRMQISSRVTDSEKSKLEAESKSKVVATGKAKGEMQITESTCRVNEVGNLRADYRFQSWIDLLARLCHCAIGLPRDHIERLTEPRLRQSQIERLKPLVNGDYGGPLQKLNREPLCVRNGESITRETALSSLTLTIIIPAVIFVLDSTSILRVLHGLALITSVVR
ncbi:hypothetical protein K0M31_012262 [Melipona bicolor]|uniref:Uncharacterized protein n=1 Tax=Melipona bicolor TaxID=60889 RepID=A0AA40KHU4_9HYME|nr:hypothetical protein K0M31_012262 [Melipona bicolor]